MDLSDEMKEAIRILREDGQIAAYNKLSDSHKALVERLDEVEDHWSEFRAANEKPKEEGTTSVTPPTEPTPTVPQPPPVVEPEPEPVKKDKLHWWERGNYSD